ncbi:relaxase/mobilization nuclease domain-containing protein [Maribacter sp. 1_2014MBL_MicDiv]|uniref:relaxase/mobilization nuclease domain-containing protein n=1 Tax=Maribacter sp. 1_2014MBL_MicDiv TaxID=1644130 RepID=UPI0008F4D19E|nr:relaxase/mobilization nuclease domain-containing protein [Maribacter sp. 1_2014MBL_MicDiv]APA64264.1 hypothetical protein YQ22_07975 [Maribacter sp. 1_2014MBL_MicDiv]
MIGKVNLVSNNNTIAYSWDQEKDATVVLRQNLLGENSKEISNEFKTIQNMNVKCKKNTMSFIISPTIKDGQKLTDKQFGEIAQRFITEMKLTNHQAIAFTHSNTKCKHMHLIINRINFNGRTYNDSFIGKRTTFSAEKVAKSMGLKTVQDVQNEKLDKLKNLRLEIQNIHKHVMKNSRPKTFDDYIKKMASKNIQVIPSINKGGRLQGFRFEFKGVNLKGSEVHRSMSGGKIANELATNSSGKILQHSAKAVNIGGSMVELSTNFLSSLAKKAVKQVITKGMEIGI